MHFCTSFYPIHNRVANPDFGEFFHIENIHALLVKVMIPIKEIVGTGREVGVSSSNFYQDITWKSREKRLIFVVEFLGDEVADFL
jgi:hypothetical protein